MRDVPAQNPCLHALCPNHVVGNQQEVLSVQPGVVFRDDVGELLLRPRVGVALEQQVQDRHEVRLTRAERAMQVCTLAVPGFHRRRDQP